MAGEHVTSDNMFKVAKINRQSEEVAEREKEKKSWVGYHVRRKAALPINDRFKNDLENNNAWLTIKHVCFRFCFLARSD
jgi:hypothetical protein